MPFADRRPSLRRGLAAALIVLLGGLSAQAFVPRRTGIVVRCSPTVLRAVQAAAEEYMADHPNVRVAVLAAGPRRVHKAVAEGTADLGIATRDESAAVPLTREPLGRVALAFLVHPSNPVKSLDRDQLAGLFDGRLRSWDQVGGPKLPVHVYAVEPTSGLYDILKTQVLGPTRVARADTRWIPDAQMVRRVAEDPAALGFVHLGHVGPGVGVLAVHDVIPDLEAVRSRRYQVHQELELLMLPEQRPVVVEFARHLASADRHLTERLVVPLP